MKYDESIEIEAGDKITLKPYNVNYSLGIAKERWNVTKQLQLTVFSKKNSEGLITVSSDAGCINLSLLFVHVSAINRIVKKKKYGIWNDVEKRFVFGIKEDSVVKAATKFSREYYKISHMWRYEVKEIPVGFVNPKNPTNY